MLYNVSYCRVLILRICQFPHRSINKGLLLEWVCGILAFGHLRIGSWSTRKPSVSKQGIKAAFRSKRREKKFFTFYVWHPDCWKVWEKFDKYVQQIFVCLTRHKLFCLVCGRRIFDTSWIAEISGVGKKTNCLNMIQIRSASLRDVQLQWWNLTWRVLVTLLEVRECCCNNHLNLTHWCQILAWGLTLAHEAIK